MCTTGQVTVRVMSGTLWTRLITSVAQLVHARGLGADDDVVRAGDVLGDGDAGDATDLDVTSVALPTAVCTRM